MSKGVDYEEPVFFRSVVSDNRCASVWSVLWGKLLSLYPPQLALAITTDLFLDVAQITSIIRTITGTGLELDTITNITTAIDLTALGEDLANGICAVLKPITIITPVDRRAIC